MAYSPAKHLSRRLAAIQSGVTPIPVEDGSVTNAKLAAAIVQSVKANPTNGLVSPGDLAIGTNALVGRGTGNLASLALGSGLAITGGTIDTVGGSGTNLTYTAATRIVASDTGTDATLPLMSSTDAGLVPASGGGTANFLRADGTFAAPGGGGSGNAVAASLAFGASFTDKAQTVVTGQAWVAAGSKITAQVLCPSGTDPDEMYLLNFQPVISDLVVGTGFTVTLYSQPEAKGTYTVNCIGV